jgi:nitronate monooxygenase
MISGKEVLPLIEGGKGVSISNGQSAGAFAAAGAVGTFSGVNADSYDEAGQRIVQHYRGRTRSERHAELIQYGIQGAITQAKMAYDIAGGRGRIHMNVLWEMAAVEPILEGVLQKVSHLVHGITCGAGMPYRLAEICSQFKVFYIPIVSSARAFKALWKRAYHRFSDWLGGVVYEDPWRAGGHNGLSNQENPLILEDPYPRVVALRQTLREYGLHQVPIIMAGGVWNLKEYESWLDDPVLGPIAFQFGTRPLLTQESPISDAWKKRLPLLQPGEVSLHKFSPTGFYSSAVRNPFLQELHERSMRQISYTQEPVGDHDTPLKVGQRDRFVYVTHHDYRNAIHWLEQGYTQALRTPDQTLIFVTPEKAYEIHQDQVNCMGCLSACLFSNWSQHGGSTGRKADPRSFCIQKTLQEIAHGGDIDHNLMFAGHNVYRFGQDPFYQDGFIPTVQQLVDRIQLGL